MSRDEDEDERRGEIITSASSPTLVNTDDGDRMGVARVYSTGQDQDGGYRDNGEV